MVQRVYNFHASDATRESILLRAGLCGPTGSGKTKTALIIATRMVERLGLGPVFVIDSENKSALRYAYSPRSKQGFRFKHVPMPEDDYSPAAYMAALDYCESQGAGVIVIDSLSHAWNGINGVLEQVDQVTERSRSKNSFSEGWKTMTPVHNRLIQRILGCSTHVLFTLRAKTDWVVQENERGKREPMKVGLAPVQREGVDYEPDLFFDMTVPDNVLVVSKSRCDRLTPGETVRRPGVEFTDVIIEWIEDSEPPTQARTLGEAVNLAVTEGVLAWEEKSADRYKEARRKLLAWCDGSGVGTARRDTALAQFKERVAAAAGPNHVAPPADATTPQSNSDGANAPAREQHGDPDLRAVIDRMAAASSADEVQAAARPVFQKWKADTDEGRAFRSSLEANMQRFQHGWTIASAQAATQGKQDGGAPPAAQPPKDDKGAPRGNQRRAAVRP